MELLGLPAQLFIFQIQLASHPVTYIGIPLASSASAGMVLGLARGSDLGERERDSTVIMGAIFPMLKKQ